MKTFNLTPHPNTPCPFIEALEVSVERRNGGGLYCSYELRGAIDRLVIPAPAALPARTDELWRQTCCEIFLKPGNATLYDEFNFSPSGNWAAYRFEHYRAGMVELEMGEPPRILCQRDTDRLRLDVLIASGECPDSPLRMALSAVLKGTDGATYYWALQHPTGKPDFHHDAGFVTAADA
ncbi:DOMON-like domain-containing protein [Povalibacter sp.]|uniref:DOMON-like domain-containing protein n=1 Tax=Povalibacter sp. TaxID=1962978 RepID=UPI002F3F211E